MDMSASEAISRLQELKGQAEEASVMQRAVAAHFEQIAKGLMGLSDRGFTPGRMPMAIMLANETKENAQQNSSRAFSLYQGIGEMI